MKARIRVALLAASTLTLAVASTGRAEYRAEYFGLCENRCYTSYQSCLARSELPEVCYEDYQYCVESCSW